MNLPKTVRAARALEKLPVGTTVTVVGRRLSFDHEKTTGGTWAHRMSDGTLGHRTSEELANRIKNMSSRPGYVSPPSATSAPLEDIVPVPAPFDIHAFLKGLQP